LKNTQKHPQRVPVVTHLLASAYTSDDRKGHLDPRLSLCWAHSFSTLSKTKSSPTTITMSGTHDIFQPLPWDMMRRNSIGMSGRRNSLLSFSLFDFTLFPTKQGVESDPDPFAPLSIHEGIPLTKHQPQPQPQPQPSNTSYKYSHTRDHMLNDRSESSGTSVPSLSATTYASHGSSHTIYDHNAHSARPVVPSFVPSAVTSMVTSMAPVSRPDGCIDDDDDEMNQHRFKPFHEEKWTLRYKELLVFHREHAHSAVPHTYPKNPQLARWVKRQRRQYKLRKDSRASTMTSERLDLLNSVGFVWDSHDVNWREKLDGLEAFRIGHGHCNVPSNFADKKLATWVKCQRRQYKLYWDGKPSAMSPERILELEKVGFEWEIRATAPRNAPVTAQADDYQLLYQTITDL
jgi:hypothetical protein